MRNNIAPEKDKKIGTVNTSIINDIQAAKDKILKVRLNKKQVLLVNKEKLVEKSHYFKLITKPCFADHKSEFTEVTFPVSVAFFEKVIFYLITDIIDISNDTVFEIFQISDYLQIESLTKICLNHFIYNLNIRTLRHQVSLMEKYPLLCKNFEEITLKFKESGRPSFKGLYQLEINQYSSKSRLRLISDEPDYLININNLKSDILHYFSNTMILQHQSSDKNLLIQYDLISGNLVEIKVEIDCRPIICSDNESLFVINPITASTKINDISLSILQKDNNDTLTKVCKTFSLSNLDKPNFYNWFNWKTSIKFSICDNGKLYFFYEPTHTSTNESNQTLFDYLDGIHIVTICIETMTLLSIRRLTESIRYNRKEILTQKEKIKNMNLPHKLFKNLFFLKKSHKCFIKISLFNEIVLVFDTKKLYFDFAVDMLPRQERYTTDDKYTVDRDDLIYMVTSSGNKQIIRTLQYVNGKIVDAGIKRESFMADFTTEVKSICIV